MARLLGDDNPGSPSCYHNPKTWDIRKQWVRNTEVLSGWMGVRPDVGSQKQECQEKEGATHMSAERTGRTYRNDLTIFPAGKKTCKLQSCDHGVL